VTHDTRAGSVDIDSVRVRERYRVDLGSLDDLSESIRDIGLLHPIVVTRDLRLVAGQRRLEACRRLGWSEIPATFVAGIDEASALLVAERDENTCRKPMTASELYALGKALEEMERPKAQERMSEGGKRGASERWDGVGSTDPTLSTGRTYEVVAPAVDMSPAKWKRLKHIGDRAASGDQEAAAIMKSIDNGTKTVGGGYASLRSQEDNTQLGNVGDKRSIPRKKGAEKQLRQLSQKVKHYGELARMINLEGLTKEEADSIAADLSQGLTALNALKNKLRKVST
jgi:hypothetical protein